MATSGSSYSCIIKIWYFFKPLTAHNFVDERTTISLLHTLQQNILRENKVLSHAMTLKTRCYWEKPDTKCHML